MTIIAKESDEGVRMLHVIDPARGIKMNHVMAYECHDDMDLIMSKMQVDLNKCMDFQKSIAN